MLLTIINEQLPPPDCPTLNQTKICRYHQPNIDDFHLKLVTLTQGIDVATISGFSDKTFLKLVAEIGTNVDAWPSAKNFTSWLGLRPINARTGKTKRKKNRAKTAAGQIFKEVAMAIGQGKYLALGSFFRRIRSKRGPRVAVMATARKLAIQFYNLMKWGTEFVEQGIDRYEEIQKRNLSFLLPKKLKNLAC